MSQDPNQSRIGAITGTEAKTPAERGKQIQELQELQRAAEAKQAQPAAPAQNTAAAAGTTAPPKTTASGSEHLAVYDVNPVAQVDMLKGPSSAGTDQAVYGAKQADAASLGSRNDIVDVRRIFA